MKESDYNYWHNLVSTERPDELPNGCEYQGSEGWKPETRDPAVWGYLLRRWPKDQRTAPKMRAMTVKEKMTWAGSAESDGWMVKDTFGNRHFARCWDYETEHDDLHRGPFTRARIESLNDDGTGGEWQAFEVEA